MLGVVTAEAAGTPVTIPYFIVWNCSRSGLEHDLEEAFAAGGRVGAGLRAREVKEADGGGEGGVGAQVGVVRIEPVVQKGLAHRREHALVGGTHAGGARRRRCGPTPASPVPASNVAC